MQLVILNKEMKKLFLIILLLVGAFFIYKYAFKKEGQERAKPESIAVSRHSGEFNKSVDDILNSYYSMANDFVNWDSLAVNNSASALQTATNNFKVEELKKDSIIYETAIFPLDICKNSIATIIQSKDWEERRRAFQELSESLRLLLITVKYDQNLVYWQECPMAFGEGNSGNWLSDKKEIINPYLGNKSPKYGKTMLSCGETKETIDFTKVADSTK